MNFYLGLLKGSDWPTLKEIQIPRMIGALDVYRPAHFGFEFQRKLCHLSRMVVTD